MAGSNPMERFASRKFLKRKTRLEYLMVDGWPVLHLEEPALLARFVADLKQTGGKSRDPDKLVFARGQARHHGSMQPSLFRGQSPERTSDLLSIETEACRLVQDHADLRRFERPHLAALLQHYGLNTSWLDVVDNLWMAIWFATHTMNSSKTGQKMSAQTSTEEYGWIYLVETRSNSGALTSVDLRRDHHSLSVRPHIQHGLSVTSEGPDLSDWIIATVRFPNDGRWTVAGHLFDPGVLFPPRRFDHTLDKLLGKKLDGALRDLERTRGLDAGSLGSIYWVPGATL